MIRLIPLILLILSACGVDGEPVPPSEANALESDGSV